MALLEIPAGETGLIRVFAVNLPCDDVAAQIDETSKAAVAQSLLGQPLPDTGFDLFPLADLMEIGLTGYLIQGYAVPKEQLDPERARLEALDGYALLVFSSAFEGKSATIKISPALSHIATFGENLSETATIQLESDAAKPYSGTPSGKPSQAPQRNRSGSMIVAILVVFIGLILWIATR